MTLFDYREMLLMAFITGMLLGFGIGALLVGYIALDEKDKKN